LVDSWLDYAELELGSQNPPRLPAVIDVLEKHLVDRVFMVGQRFTLADVSLGCSLYQFEKQGIAKVLPTATRRWLGTCAATEAFKHVLGNSRTPTKVASATPAPRAAPQAPQAPQAPSSKPGSTAEDGLIAKYSRCVGGRTRISRVLRADDGGEALIGQIVSICGWVRTKREGGKGAYVFLNLNDGSCVGGLQVVCDGAAKGFEGLKAVNTGSSVKCTGEIVKSQGKEQSVELRVAADEGHSVEVYCAFDVKDYPLAKKKHGREFLREKAHLRPRSNLIACVARVRAAMAQATHEFFRSRGFLYVHTPLITAADCEGAGEMFQVTTLLNDKDRELPKSSSAIDYTKDFFGKPAFLTVSGQLSVENYCCALSNVYTFGPTFRAENSHTSRHLAEFWMIEPELAFADLFDDMDCAEDYVKFCVQYALDNNREELEWFEDKLPADGCAGAVGLVARLENLLKEPFGRLTYTEAVEILIQHSPKAKFEVPVTWGMDLGSEHERYLVEKVMNKATFVYNYPKDIKAFYMRLNDDQKTVAATDMLVPGIGELIGGSQREERLDVLDIRCKEMNLDPKDYWWYRELRQYGSIPHSGFGLGFERLIMYVTGVDNIRDVIPFPRYPGHAEF
jgi:asparaginyl-tRNA synthetase